MNSILSKITSKSLFLSIVFGTVLMLVFALIWDSPIKKFKVDVEPYFSESAAQQVYWFAEDIDNDGNSEMIRCGYGEGSERLDITLYDKAGYLTSQFHIFNSKWNYNFVPAIYDIDDDNHKELFFFIERNDSIFLNAFSLRELELTIDHLFFKEIERKRKEYSYRAAFYDFADYNNDGIKELYFEFDAGFGLYPRGIFKIEFPSLKILGTDTEYMAIFPEYSHDISGDGIPEIFVHSYSPSNTTQYKKYSDTISYIAVFDSNLKFLFEPIAFPGEYGYVRSVPDMSNDTLFYAVFVSRSSNRIPLSVFVLNNKGTILKSKQWQMIDHPESMSYSLFIINNQAWFFCNGMGYYKMDSELSELPDKITRKFNDLRNPMLGYDLTEDGVDEWISTNRTKEIFIYDEITDETVSFQLPLSIYREIKIFPIYKENVLEKYMIDTGGGFFYFHYQRNPRYYFLYFIYFGVFLTGSFSVWLILYLQKQTIEKKWQIEKQLSELQFNSVKNQLNPHFLFNSLNSVALMINEGRQDEAYDFLFINSRMMQRVMDNASQITCSLRNEVQFTKDYLNIQKQRFKDRFIFKVDISSDVDLKFEVPKMCIHTYVENSIKHGFRNIKVGGELLVRISAEKHGVKIVIADNGMGRVSASKYQDSTGNGIRIMEEFYQLFEKYHGYNIHCSITDNYLENPSFKGTFVELKIEKP